MPLDPASALDAEFTSRRGEHLARSFTRASGSTAFDPDSLVIEIRDAPEESGELVASSVPDRQTGRVAVIDLTGTDLAASSPVVAWSWTALESTKIPAGDRYWIEATATVAGDPRVILPWRRWRHLARVAVRPQP